MKNIIVTGGCGYIGSHTVVALIEHGYNPIILDNLQNSDIRIIRQIEKITGIVPDFFIGDVRDSKILSEIRAKYQQIEGIIHFAALKAVAESVHDPLAYYDNNLQSLISILRFARDEKIRHFVFSSSCTVYGNPTQLPVTEATPFGTISSPYGNTKKIGEEIMKDLMNSGAPLKMIGLRYFNPVGAHPSGLIGEMPDGTPNNLLPYITRAARGSLPKLTIFGNDYDTPDGTCIRDFIHVDDLAEAHVKAIGFLVEQKQESILEVLNVGTGKGNSVLELIQKFQSVNNVKVPFKIGPRRPGDIEQIYASVKNCKAKLGWESKKSIDDALRDSWNWENNGLKAFEKPKNNEMAMSKPGNKQKIKTLKL